VKEFFNKIKTNIIDSILRKLFWGILKCTSRILIFTKNSNSILEKDKNILIIQLLHIGDFVISTPIVNYITSNSPKQRIDLLVATRNKDLAKRILNINNVYALKANWVDRVKHQYGYVTLYEMLQIIITIILLYTNKYSVIYNLTNDEFTSIIIKCFNRGKLKELLPEQKYFKTNNNAHQLDYLSNSIGFEKLNVHHNPLDHVIILKKEKNRIEELLRTLPSDKKKIILHMDSRVPSKSWSEKNWEYLINSLIAKNFQILLIGSKNNSLKINCNQIIDLRNSTSIGELIILLKYCDLFIGTDSGPAHLTYFTGTKAIILFSSANSFSRWRPLNPNAIVINHDVDCKLCHLVVCPYNNLCMELITPDEVMILANKILGKE